MTQQWQWAFLTCGVLLHACADTADGAQNDAGATAKTDASGPTNTAQDAGSFPSSDASATDTPSSDGGSIDGGSIDGGSIDGGPSDPGALIRITSTSTVGVLLDELPEALRERVVSALLAKPDSFFIERAKRQLALATYRLNFRPFFYDEGSGKKQLPLPPESVLELELIPDENGDHVRRATVEGHDYVLADYALHSVVVTNPESPAVSEPALADVGGTWDEPFTFPVDPELLVQRTGYACMDEAEFPPNSVDTENVEFFYDATCEVEDELTPDGCHYTELPEQSCLDALTDHVGKVDIELHYERLPWDTGLADTYRVGEVLSEGVADLAVVTEELLVNRLIYRYIDSDSCALAEACVGGEGWRRLLLFNASEKNVGSAPVNIGDVDYFVDDPDNPTPNANHHVYQYSDCHGHYHFNYFATFTYGNDPDLGSKRAFCLESVARYSNHEQSPTWSDYNDCSYQGISEGWGDQYNAGIECQWVDVTTVDTSEGPVTRALGLQSNPEGFLCEGTPVLDADGNPTWEPTELTTEDGDSVDRPVCDEFEGWDENNDGEQDVTLPVPGEGMLTEPCTRGQLGPRRNCGFTYGGELLDCEPGETVSLSCIAEGATPSVVRVCEASSVLGAGTACWDAEALAYQNLNAGDVDSGAGAAVSLTFTCPSARSELEPGGKFALYQAPLWPEDELATATCAID